MIERLPGERPLAGTPGFHSLERTVLAGVRERGELILEVYCACDPVAPVARINATTTERADAFTYWATGRTKLQISPALDIVIDGHFVSDDPWTVEPEGMLPNMLPATRERAARKNPKRRAVAARPAANTDAPVGACPYGLCPHGLDVHSPCSLCGCPTFPNLEHGGGEKTRAKLRAISKAVQRGRRA